nr:GGDEF domain-containing protein [Rhizobium halophytocola]
MRPSRYLRIDPEVFRSRRNVHVFALKAAVIAVMVGGAVDCLALPVGAWFGLMPPSSAPSMLLTIFSAALNAGLGAGILAWLLGFVIRDLARSKARFRHLSRVDGLSGLLNRRGLNEELELDHVGASLAIFDLDRFKVINDTHGHVAGDQVIREIAGIIRKLFPAPNVTARLGGEEFAVIIVGGSPRKRLERVERIRAQIGSHLVRHDKVDIAVSVSVGVADFDGRDGNAVYSAADRALYLAKAAGRDRVVHEAELSRPLASYQGPAPAQLPVLLLPEELRATA